MSDAAPEGKLRFDLIDALRGFALFGVLMVNLRSLSLYEFLPADQRALLPTPGIDRYLESILAVFIDLKSITLFTFLFGVGFALQMPQTRRSNTQALRFARRMLILLLIGLVHAYVFWWGDILRYYALAGLLLIPLSRLSPRILFAGGIIVLLLPAVLQPWARGLLPVLPSSADAAAASLQAFSSERLDVALQGNLERDLRMRMAIWMLPFFVFGRVMIGVAMGRSGVLFEPERHLAFWRRCLFASLAIALPLTAIFLLRDHAEAFAQYWPQDDSGRAMVRVLRELTPVALGIAYVAGFVLLFQAPFWRPYLAWLAPLGRMALSHYLAQTVIGIFLFYGIGLGIGPRYGQLGIVVVCVCVFALQAMVSHVWLARFRFGPVEWLWRSLTYGQKQAMRRGASTSVHAAAIETVRE
jgi:uncharacterized protein